jgi:hypothetical protein
MPEFDIPVPVDLKKAFDIPPCEEIKLPSPEPLSITLPTGGSLKALTDISKGIPNDCSMTFNLMLQIAPFLAASDCLFKLLGIVAPLIDVIKGLGPPPNPLKLGKAIPKFLKAAEKLAPCLLAVTGAPLIPFIKDLLCLILKALNCFLGQMKSILAIMKGLEIQLDAAKSAGNFELQRTVECAQENATLAAQNLTRSLEPLGAILALAQPLMELAGIPDTIKIAPPVAGADVAAFEGTIRDIQGVVGTIQVVADALGGC